MGFLRRIAHCIFILGILERLQQGKVQMILLLRLEELEALLAEIGFQEVSVEVAGQSREFSDGRVVAADAIRWSPAVGDRTTTN